MTVQKVKDWLIALEESEEINEFYYADNFKDALKIAVENIAELEQYRALGTVEELKEAREKQIPKKPTDFCIKDVGSCRRVDLICPTCNNAIVGQPYKPNYCKHCGQALKWGEEDD